MVRGALAEGAGLLTVTGLQASWIGELAASASIVLHELTPLASLRGASGGTDVRAAWNSGAPGQDPVNAGEGGGGGGCT